ncbi:MAG: CDP-alcohol phosphatidyltransferase family protein [Chloroflexota bacterium]
MAEVSGHFTIGDKVKAWSVHAFTATGGFWGLLGLYAAVNQDWRMVFFWMIVATFVDAVDGYFARLANVKKVIPHFDGALLDNIIDYFTYVLLPAAVVYLHPNLMPSWEWAIGAAAIMSMTSGYQFCRTDAKTEDHTFLGFPSYWNIVVMYLVLLTPNPWVSFALLALCGVLVFVPIKYAYPSRMLRFQTPTLVLSYIWGAILAVAIFMYPNHPIWLVYTSLFFSVYYIGISLYMMFR